MKTQTQKTGETTNISGDKLISIINQLFGGTNGTPNPDEPFKPGPWDPVIRKVVYHLGEPQPIPWQIGTYSNQNRLEFFARFNQAIWEVIGGWGKSEIAVLNPQPIPALTAFIAAFTHEAIDRVLLTQEVADELNQTGEQSSKIIVGNRLSQLVDEMCGNGFKYKFPIPRPKHDVDNKLSGVELLTAGAIFEQTAQTIFREDLRQELRNAGAKLIEAGISRM